MKKYIKWILLATISVVNIVSCTRYSGNNSITQQPTTYSHTKSSRLQEREIELSSKKKLQVPIISQNPELKNGCEVTSLAMLLQYSGIEVDKMTLAEQIKKDTTPLERNDDGTIKSWGDPEVGFVGDITGKEEGFGVYTGPMLELLELYMPDKGLDLSHQSFERLLQSIDNEKPVIIWVTADFDKPDSYVEWEKNGKNIKATFDEHAVLLVGYNKKYCYINNPYTGEKNQKISRKTLEEIWGIMGNMAISYTL